MKNGKITKIITLILGILGGFYLGALITLAIIVLLDFKFNWFEGMAFMVALLLLVPLGGIVSAITIGLIYNKRLNKILADETKRKKELALLIILPSLLILMNLYPRFTTLYSFSKPASTINFTDSMGRLYYSSSELNKPSGNKFGKYGVQNLFDHDKNTCWAEGVKGPGINEYIYLNISGEPRGIYILNGYGKSKNSFKANNRIKKLQLTLYKLTPPKEEEVTELYTPMKVKKISEPYKRELKDSAEPQQIYFTSWWQKMFKENKETVFQLKILSVYPGEKHDDTCLSEISFFYDKPDKLFLSENERELWQEKSGRKRFLLKSEKDMFFQLISSEGDWAILTKMPLQTEGRVESQFFLFNTRFRKEADFLKSGFDITEFYGFIKDDKELFIDAFDNAKSKQIRVNVKDIKLKNQ